MKHISTIIDDLDLNDDLAHEYELDRRNDEFFESEQTLDEVLVTAEANSFINVARLLSLPQLLNQHAILCCQLDEAGFSASDSIVVEVNAIVKEVRNG